MAISHTATVSVNEPTERIDLGAWLFGLTDDEHQARAKGHHGAGTYTDAPNVTADIARKLRARTTSP